MVDARPWRRVGSPPPSAAPPAGPVAVRGHLARLSHPLLYCDEPGASGGPSALRGAFEARVAAGVVAAASVAYTDLESGRSSAIEPTRRFQPASLLKLPIAMAWMRRGETDPGALDRAIPFRGATARESPTGPGALISGQTYTPRDLLDRMIRWSRNDAKAALREALGDEALRAIYLAIDVPWPFSDPGHEPLLTVADFARMFRVLYDASVLHAAASDDLLAMLAHTAYPAGLRAGIPPSIQVAHKWGLRILADTPAARSVQLHDCGIVYRPNRPFLLCVMTEGRKEADQAALIAELARAAWQAP